MSAQPRSLSLSKGLEEVGVPVAGAEALTSPSTSSGREPSRLAEENA